MLGWCVACAGRGRFATLPLCHFDALSLFVALMLRRAVALSLLCTQLRRYCRRFFTTAGQMVRWQPAAPPPYTHMPYAGPFTVPCTSRALDHALHMLVQAHFYAHVRVLPARRCLPLLVLTRLYFYSFLPPTSTRFLPTILPILLLFPTTYFYSFLPTYTSTRSYHAACTYSYSFLHVACLHVCRRVRQRFDRGSTVVEPRRVRQRFDRVCRGFDSGSTEGSTVVDGTGVLQRVCRGVCRGVIGLLCTKRPSADLAAGVNRFLMRQDDDGDDLLFDDSFMRKFSIQADAE